VPLILRRLALSLFLVLFFSLSWLALWIISLHLTQDSQQATLLLPQGLRLALLILLPRRYWPTLLVTESAILLWLNHQQLLNAPLMLMLPWLSLLPAWFTQRLWYRYHQYWQRLSLLLAAMSSNTLLYGLLAGPWIAAPVSQTLLTTFTGGVLLVPFIYLVHTYLKQQLVTTMPAPRPLTPQIRPSLLLWCSLFFTMGICAQVAIAPEMERLLLIFIFLPNVLMAYLFGWQGGVLAALFGSLLITLTRQAGGAFQDLRELELFLSTQALLGIGLGIAISRQQQLAQKLQRYRQQLERELVAKRHLMERLVTTEEETRKDIARELHDEIGQNITAIQIQAMLVSRTTTTPAAHLAAEQIDTLSQRIHHTTRTLLRQLRPPVLEEMAFDKALNHLAHEFAFAEQGIDFHLDYHLPEPPTDKTLLFTLYRVAQETLNNISKHACASHVRLRLTQNTRTITLEVRDNGQGMPPQTNSGFGLLGIEERVRALGGDWLLQRSNGTRVIVNLPTKLNETPS